MKISRSGASANWGESSIEFKSPQFAWSKVDACLTIKESNVKDFSTNAHHNYTVRLSLAEIQSLLETLSDAAMSEPVTFEKGLEPSIKSLVRLKAVVAGLAG
jgi:hypothetical protein